MKHDVVVKVEELRKEYGAIIAVAGVSFEIYRGEIFGMVGTNGAGKTTTIECIEGLRKPKRGGISILGLDPQLDSRELRHRIGVQLQESQLQPRLKVWEALDLFAAFYPNPIDWRTLIERLGLTDKLKSPYAKLSGGQKQRLQIALALINDPEVVFFDELTTGLDPQARRSIWDLVRSVRDSGKTVFLTTHFMDEAERLCDRVAIMDRGKIVALDTPENLIRDHGKESRIIFTVMDGFNADALKSIGSVSRVEKNGERVIVQGSGDMLIVEVVTTLAKLETRFRDLRTEQPNLEDVFLALTGREMKD